MAVIQAELSTLHAETLSQWKTWVQEICQLDLAMGAFRRDGALIGGPGVEVQIDETLINKRKPSVLTAVARPYARQVWLWGAVVSTPGDVQFVFDLPRHPADAEDGRPRGKKELRKCILAHIAWGSHVVHDSWRAYLYMDWADMGLTHGAVNHRREFVNAIGEHTNRIEATWSVLKRWLRKRHNGRLPQTDDMYLYLYEFVWRRRVGDAFYGMLRALRRLYGDDMPLGVDRAEWLQTRFEQYGDEDD